MMPGIGYEQANYNQYSPEEYDITISSNEPIHRNSQTTSPAITIARTTNGMIPGIGPAFFISAIFELLSQGHLYVERCHLAAW